MTKKQNKIALMGVGTIGKELLKRVQNSDIYKFVAIGDSLGYLTKKEGFTSEEITEIINYKNLGKHLTGYPDRNPSCLSVIPILKENAVDTLIDVTASQTFDILYQALDYSNVITSNKLPFSDISYEKYFKINKKSVETRKFLDYGTTVGAGLKILKIIDLIGAEGVKGFSGCLSGTMNYISQRLNENISFSNAMCEAMASPRNYAEPDPRSDISGNDFKRKIVILARLFGKKINMVDIKADSILQTEHFVLSRDEFLKILPELDKEIAIKMKTAKKEKKALWYLGSANLLTNEYSLGFQKISFDDPITKCKESDNALTFQPILWRRPVTLIGPGAGASETVSGLLSGLKEIFNKL